MRVFIDDRRPTGVCESPSGTKAFYINAALIDDWYLVEMHPEFRRLDRQAKDDIRDAFPRSLLTYHKS